MLTLEKRPTSPARLATIALTVVCVTVAAMAFVPPLWIAYDLSALSAGDRASVGNDPSIPSGHGTVLEVHDDGTATVKMDSGEVVTAPMWALSER